MLAANSHVTADSLKMAMEVNPTDWALDHFHHYV